MKNTFWKTFFSQKIDWYDWLLIPLASAGFWIWGGEVRAKIDVVFISYIAIKYLLTARKNYLMQRDVESEMQ